MLINLLHHFEEEFGGLVDATLLGGCTNGEDINLAAEEAAVAPTSVHHRGGRLFAYLIEALVDHHIDEVAHEHLAICTHCSVGGLLVLPVECQAGAGGLLVGSNADEGFHVGGNFVAQAR